MDEGIADAGDRLSDLGSVTVGIHDIHTRTTRHSDIVIVAPVKKVRIELVRPPIHLDRSIGLDVRSFVRNWDGASCEYLANILLRGVLVLWQHLQA